MKNIEEILELLSKENLTKSEREIVRREMDKNPDINKYQSILSSLKNSREHLSIDLISDYILYSNGQEPNTENFNQLKPIINEHLLSCEICSEHCELLSEEFGSIDEYLEEKISDEPVIKPAVKSKRNMFDIFLNPLPKYSLAAAFGFVAIYLGLFMFSQLTTPKYLNLARLSNLENLETTRGRTTELFIKGMEALEADQLDSAISYFQSDIDQSTSDNTLFYTHYILGMIYLRKSQSDFAGLFISNDKDDLNMAIINFVESINTNNSGSFDNIKLNSYYFLANVYMLNENIDTAKRYLDKVISSKGPYYREAVSLMAAID